MVVAAIEVGWRRLAWAPKGERWRRGGSRQDGVRLVVCCFSCLGVGDELEMARDGGGGGGDGGRI